MKTLIYIGNQLSQKNKTATTIDTLSALLRSENYNVIVASSKENKVFRLMDMLYHILKYRNVADFVLIDTYSTTNFYYAYICGRLCRMMKLKYIPILHGGDLPKRLGKSPRLSSRLFQNARVNVAPSLYLKSYFESVGYKNLAYIPNTIELKDYEFKKRTLSNIRLLWVRSFSKLYNPQLAIRLLKAFKDQNTDVSLCMVGPDNDGSLVEAKALAKKLGVAVEFTGKLTKAQWHQKSKDFNIFLNTTNIDNTPVSVIEAMALGLPVISTNVGGIPFLIENNVDGILVEPSNVMAFKNAIVHLMDNEQVLDDITTNARQKVEQFDWEIVKQKWISVLSH